MLNRSFDELTTKEKFRLQAIEKKAARDEPLDEEQRQLYERFHARYAQELQAAKGRWPIILGLLVISSLAILSQCSG